MRRLPGILLATAAIAIIIVALLVSGLRFFLPHINEYRQQLAEKIAAVTDIPVNIGYINGHWESFGPILELRDISAKAENVDIQARKITLSLDIWRSLLQRRWYFRDLSFYQLQVNYNKALFGKDDENQLAEPDSLSSLFLEQFNNFDLHDSHLTFLTPSGEKADLLIPQLTWLNKDNCHRAQGSVNLSSINEQNGVVQVKLDLKDINGVLDNGVIYLQADDIDMRMWLSHWLKDNTGLESAHFSLASWVTLKEGRIDRGLLQLKQGEADWHVGNEKHQLAVNDLLLQMRRQGESWLFAAPNLASLKTDDRQWPEGKVTALYAKQSSHYQSKDHWRIRAENIQLEYLNGILPILSFMTPDIVKDWQHRQPKGMLNSFALDITPERPEDMGIRLKWQDVSWQRWKELPSANHFSGSLDSNNQRGNLKFELKNSIIDYGSWFQAPLDIASSKGQITWKNDQQGMTVWSKGLDLQAKSLWFNGDFHYRQRQGEQPELEILAGARLDNAGEAWRYFPKPLMGESLTDYLTASLIKGKVDNATLIFKGNPHDFPFEQNQGQFQVFVPLRHATFQYQPDWLALFDLDIDLNFQNNGLWMQAPKARLGKVGATQVSAMIPDYGEQKLFIDAELSGDGKGIHAYFKHSPLAESIGSALDSLQLDGKVDGKLHLDIPLAQGEVNASGEVTLKDTQLFIETLDSKIENLSGTFRFDNGNLNGDSLSANWFGQPLSLQFSTQDLPKHYQVDVNLGARWAVKKLPRLPAEIRRQLSGTLNWQGKVNVEIPAHDSSPNDLTSRNDVKYNVAVNADLSHISSKLPVLDTESLREWGSIDILAQGDENQFQMKGSMGQRYAFNTQWMLEKQHVRLQRGILQTDGEGIPALPKQSLLALNLPAIDGDTLLTLIEPLDKKSSTEARLLWPNIFEISLPSLDIGGQHWNQLTFNIIQQTEGMNVSVTGDEINGNLLMQNHRPLLASINYLYYAPQSATAPPVDAIQLTSDRSSAPNYSLANWPALNVECAECWIAGLKLGKVSASIKPEGDSLILTKGQVENSTGKLTLFGRWYENNTGSYTQLKGKLSGEKFDDIASYLGVIVPIIDAPFTFDFNLNWQGVPWQPKIETLNGTLTGKMKKGAIAKLGGGRAGQLLRLISFDALLRKLQLDFSDTFGNDFNFDSISGDATIKNGVMYTDNFFIDGLAADINAKGQTDLVRRQINMELVITPEISTTVGVATAFAVNPVAGAAVFAATKVLGPLWNKISVIRYRVTGSLEQPKIDEVLRQLKENKGS
ncbi:AsmA2 domain-containing protein YhdP [Xenorhabdus hominickii]|uniref:TIGR02099 family protein n=1 Tax=Xenorhabdus hominickii TaxID=351679 RepID=A0A2G0QG00_XENHO|nr:AsmA2 domain-containing protein YhdP [Xenorhabdus hominickii]AOM42131.1 TIGR02099 family protein [Xenorhabdus hominickii]PHM58128.1 TIGR02099 family protein [Xenorhabdus hominickii]